LGIARTCVDAGSSTLTILLENLTNNSWHCTLKQISEIGCISTSAESEQHDSLQIIRWQTRNPDILD
jgi:hypothetical protein